MAVNTRTPIPPSYQSYLLRAISDGGSFEQVPTVQFLDQYNRIMSYGPSLVMFPSAEKPGTLYTVTPNTSSADFTVTRASSGSYFDRNGILRTAVANEPRLDWNPSNGQFNGVLVEPAATNLLLRSEEFNNDVWLKQGGTLVLSNVENAPNNTLTADKIYPPTSGDVRGVFQVNFPTGSYTLSIYAKKGGKNFLYFYVIGSTANTGCWFNLDTGTIGNIGSAWSNPKIETIKDGWYRCSANVTLTNTSNWLYYFTSDNNNSLFVSANGTDGIFLWGAQLETGTVATSYIPTQATTGSRAADNITRNVSSIIGQRRGAVYIEFTSLPANNFRRPFHIAGTVSTSYLSYYINPSNTPGILTLDCKRPDVTLPTTNVGTLREGINRLAYLYTETSQKTFLNGSLRRTDTFSELTTDWGLTNCFLGYLLTQVLNGSIKFFALYTRALSDEEAINLTTL